jgi:hypothetical protein
MKGFPGIPQILLKWAKQGLPLNMLCGVSLRFNVLGDEVLGSVSNTRSRDDKLRA